MSYLRFVCLLASTLTAAAVLLAVAQSPALQRGISVQMAVTSNAAAMPDADNEGASIVSITVDGSIYVGVDLAAPPSLADAIKASLSNHAKRLYIKADARAPYSTLEAVLEAARAAGVAAPVLLTSQPGTEPAGTVVPPKGLEVLVGAPSSLESSAVQVFLSGPSSPTLKVNSSVVPRNSWQSTLQQLLQSRSEKVVALRASGNMPFADVANAIDVCRSAGAKVVLPKPYLL